MSTTTTTTTSPSTSRCVGYTVLLSSFVAISSLGVAFDLERGAEPVLKLFWKTSGSCALLLLLVLGQRMLHRSSSALSFDRDTVRRLVLCAVGYTIWNASFNWALARTSVGHVYLLNNCHSLLLVVWRALYCDAIVLYEILGTVAGIGGSVLTALDQAPVVAHSGIVEASLLGDLGAFLGALGAVVYLLQAKTLRTRLGLLPFMLCHTLLVSLLLLPTLTLLGEEYSLSRDVNTGLFGWANLRWDRVGLEAFVVLICDFVGGMGYIRVMAYFDPLVVSIIMLMEPILATALGILVGVASIPGVLTCVGSAIVIAATMLVISVNTAASSKGAKTTKRIVLQSRAPPTVYGAV
ncbi:hypothetical protein SPRG_01328 [Saprolegnia parasitica CBS 223.65]|uniref:EamA domain-containing protein n=1 Tax=Saprolegnia parasitica (strain CBS 223.65) TaxID=695850 RepID=A0A067CTM2_SAPPC|nr:hypothetical protein SPRG_01328 [Saprolegnia parasitica CBS 223.65]KDO34054.1 hypothetical protein SPRG_01328 [Saprolegnia parasitica CBS 223.65]|eukprot:XP_012194938.1 hypothetical protein SPRG_01328 [Saprolegnia parasitica CBS 223.65]